MLLRDLYFRKWLHYGVGLLLLVKVDAVQSDSLDVNLSNDTAHMSYTRAIGVESQFGGANLDFGFLYTTTEDVIGIVGFQVADMAGSESPGLEVGVGVKGFMGTIDPNDIYAVTLGGSVRYAPPTMSRFGYFGEVYYAPDVVTFGDTERLLYMVIRVEYEVLSQAIAYIGYRKVRSTLDGGPDVTLDNGGHIGLKLLY